MARYSKEQRRRAAELYERYEHSAADVIRELGYPSKEALRMWHRDWLEERRTGIPSSRGEHYSRYTDGQRRAAVDHYLTHGRRLSRTIRQMGYPSREVLAAWIDELAPGERAVKRGPVADGVRRMAVARLAAGGVTSRQVAAEVGVEASVVRNWKRQLLHEPVPEDDPVTPDKPGKRNDGAADPDASDLDGLIAERDRVRAELERIRREKREAEIELAILKGALDLVGKERGADPDNLTNRERTILVKAVSAGHGIPAGRLLARVGLARSTYYHQLNAMKRPDRDEGLLALVRDVFENSLRRYGYRRVWLELRNAGIVVSAKRVMRLMTRHGLVPLLKRARRYSSYKGELTKAPDNLVNRVFHAEEPNRLWVTDLTEFSIPAGKVYLSPVVDCYDGMPVAWTIGTSPNAELANRMLRDACSTLGDGERPVIHSDRGCHYRWPGWISICRENGLTRSMSAKGCSPDNAAAEGFFGRLKQEFFHGRSFTGVTIEGFVEQLDGYMRWYRDERIKLAFGTSIAKRRRELGLMA